MSHDEIFAFLSSHRFAIVSTVSGTGKPQSAVVGIAVTPALDIIFDTLRTSSKARNLLDRPAASLVVWREEITVQYEGVSQELDESLEQYKEAYFQVFPDGRERQSWPGICYFVLRPRWIRYSGLQPAAAWH